ncbi:MAG TPA: chemotaxis protein CheB [Thermoanaerobaculia bacterium]|nr:chemotaxis protein CheB [Thermoanaerobaculia bacterium]
MEETSAQAASSPFPIVGVGASAGGLEAFIQMLGALPVDTGMAFVLVQHLAPKHPSLLAEILSRTTAMPVTEVQDELRVKPDRVYVIPPDRNMVISRGVLQLLPREEARGRHHPIDFFLRSLAKEQGQRAIGVILSGTATDGTLGLEAIKAEGGITFAQDNTAQQSSMPQSAVASGCVDFVLPPDEIAKEIGRLARHPYVAPDRRQASAGEPDLGKILEILRKVKGVDFSLYKANTLYRRISRRMVLHKMQGLPDYARFLRKNPGEVEALYQDTLVRVTSFFRNPETFEALKTRVLPKLFKNRSGQEPLRVWVPGCSTGEEAFSIAILFAELAAARGSQLPVQVYATDLNEECIDKARKGVYSQNIAHDVSPERLRRFFAEVDGSYRISKPIRDMCVFARHNVLTDPPFSQIDLVSCRNLLIYLEPALQQKLVPRLHFALKPAGFLLLGSSETIGSYRTLFEAEDAKHKIYAKKPGTHRVTLGQAAGLYQGRSGPGHGPGRWQPAGAVSEVQKEADRILMARYAPPGVLVNADLEILQFRGDTGPYLAPAPGKASLNLLRMTREGLLVTLRAAVNRARKDDAPVREEGVRVKSDGGTREVNLEVVPLKGSSAGERGFLVLFEEPAPSPASPPRGSRGRGKAPRSRPRAVSEEEAVERENARLARELAATGEYLQSVIEQQEAANEELQSANEEVQSANEELQSINEELETSKEEIQSSNEELATVNDELQNRNLELNQLSNDLINLLGSVEMAIIMLGPDLRVRRFTPRAGEIFNLVPTDVGRPIGDIKLKLSVPDLEPLLAEVIDTASPREREVQDSQRRWYSLRVRPYRTLENEIDGAVILLVDVDKLKQLEEVLHQRVEELAAADRSKNEFLALLAHELRNPLAPLLNAAQVLETANADGAAVEQARAMMNRQIRNMARLIDDLLDVSRITGGKVGLQRERVELATVLERAVGLTRHLIESRGQELSLSLPGEPVFLDADPVRLEQVFGNLLNNASKFTLRGGHLWVTAEPAVGGPQPPGGVVVRVRDDGIGMAPETLPRVFDLFVQADRSSDRARGGLGIGLTVVQRLVELHGGSVEAHSAGPGQGSELVVRLPVLPPAETAPERHGEAADRIVVSPALSPLVVPPRRVLVVDDNVDTAESLALLLRLKGHQVETAHDGPAALAKAHSFHPEVVLLDIGLPGLDGYQVASRLRRRRRTARALLVALTGYGQEEDQHLAREAGFDHHLTKPVDLLVIHELLARSLSIAEEPEDNAPSRRPDLPVI